jgi:putative flippase GtrA
MNVSELRGFLSMSPLIRRLFRFFGVGAMTTTAYFVFTNAAVSLGGFGAKSASVGIYLLLLPISFWAHRRVTFASRGQAFLEWVRFCSVHAVNILIAFEVSALAVDRHILPLWIAFLIVSISVPIVTFAAFQMWVFSSKSTRGCLGCFLYG